MGVFPIPYSLAAYTGFFHDDRYRQAILYVYSGIFPLRQVMPMNTMGTSAAATLENVSLRLGKRWILSHLNFEIAAGQITLLTGENGAGKTTLLRLLSTALTPSRGTLSVWGKTGYAAISARQRIGLVTHANHLYDDLSALENLQLVASFLAPSPSGQRIHALLERVGLMEHAHRPVGPFSAGMKRRLCIARLMLKQADLILLDEPFGQLDVAGVALMEDLVKELRDAGATLVICTHQVERGLALSDRHLVLHNGQPHHDIVDLHPDESA